MADHPDPRWGVQARATPFGLIRTYECRPNNIAVEMDRLSEDRTILGRAQGEGETWARDHTWDQLRPRYDAILQQP